MIIITIREMSHGLGQSQHGKGEGGYCVCPKCGYSVSHQPGIPCKSIVCPECNVSLLRSENQGSKTIAEPIACQKAKPALIEKTILYPKVVAEKCTACGKCIEVCPTDTIVIADGKAFVINNDCRNCKLCMRVCPENAFILD